MVLIHKKIGLTALYDHIILFNLILSEATINTCSELVESIGEKNGQEQDCR